MAASLLLALRNKSGWVLLLQVPWLTLTCLHGVVADNRHLGVLLISVLTSTTARRASGCTRHRSRACFRIM